MLLDFEAFKFSEKGKRLVQWIKTNFEKCKSDRLMVQRQWDINLEMYAGRQWLQVVGTGADAQLMTPPAPRHRVRATVNLIRPMIRMEIARQSSQEPTAFCVPTTSNESSIAAAEGGEAVWRSVTTRKNFQTRVMNDVAFWNSTTGNGFIKSVWNPTMVDSSNVVKDPVTGELTPVAGDTDIGSLRPYNLFVPDLMAKDIEDQPYTFEAYIKPVEWVKRFFRKADGSPMLLQPLKGESSAQQKIHESRYFGMANNSAVPESVMVIEVYIKPGGCEYFPEGGMVTLVGDELAQVAQEYPFSHGEFPYAHVRHIPTGKFYGDSVLVDINSLQREYNGTRSHIIESKRLMAKPQLLVPKGSMPTHKYTSEPGALVEYLPGLGKPEPLQLQSLPAYVLNELPIIKSDMDDISGQHAPTRGMSPGGGVTAATAIAFLQEKDDNLMVPTYNSIEAAIEKTARHTLLDVQEHWDVARIVRTVGIDGGFNVLELKGSEISADIKVEAGSALPESRPARQAFLMEMAQNQFISPAQLLDMLEIGGKAKLTQQIRIDKDQAVRENLKLKQLDPAAITEYNDQKVQEFYAGTNEQSETGAPMYNPDDPATFPPMVEVHDYDNHEVHIEVHNNYRKTPEFESLPQEIKAEFNRHIRLHHAYVDMVMQQQMQQAMMGMPGQGGQKPPGMPEMAPEEQGPPSEGEEMPQEGGF